MGAEGVEEDGVVASQFDVLQAIAVAQGVVSDVENVIGLMIGQMDLEKMQAFVDGVDEAALACEEMKGADAAIGRCRGCVGDVVMNVACLEDRLGAIAELGFVETALDLALARVEAVS